MNPQEARIFAAELRTDLPTLDLHGQYPDEALYALDLFLAEVVLKDSAARIIYGHGTGTLAAVVLAYLQKSPLVATIIEQAGTCICLLT
jgi:dsDNA-specific endonuclease/ATPase MutS2